MFDPGLRRRNVAANGRLVSGYGAQVHLEMQRVASYREDSLLSLPLSPALSHSRPSPRAPRPVHGLALCISPSMYISVPSRSCRVPASESRNNDRMDNRCTERLLQLITSA